MREGYVNVNTRGFIVATLAMSAETVGLYLRQAIDAFDRRDRGFFDGHRAFFNPVFPSARRSYIPLALRLEVYASDGYCCVKCQSSSRLSIDHIIPLAKGGTDDRSNLQTMCLTCNIRKGAR